MSDYSHALIAILKIVCYSFLLIYFLSKFSAYFYSFNKYGIKNGVIVDKKLKNCRTNVYGLPSGRWKSIYLIYGIKSEKQTKFFDLGKKLWMSC